MADIAPAAIWQAAMKPHRLALRQAAYLGIARLRAGAHHRVAAGNGRRQLAAPVAPVLRMSLCDIVIFLEEKLQGGRGGPQGTLAAAGRYLATLATMIGDTATPIGPTQTFAVVEVEQ